MVAALGGATLFAASGCAEDLAAARVETAPKTETPSVGDGTERSTDGAAFIAPAPGSPLCGYAAESCFPDDDGRRVLPVGADPCVEPAVDGGGGNDAGTAKRCRIEGTGTTCEEGSDPDGLDGASCSAGRGCAPGFECVSGNKGGVCRRYCCSGSCEAHTSQNGGATFCDIQELADSKKVAPVCMPVKKCKLFAPDGCSDRETCAVVDEDGATACVAVGAAAVGESCVERHCQESLTCLGSPANRLCYALCRVDGSTCPSGEKCTTSTLFEPGFGICKQM